MPPVAFFSHGAVYTHNPRGAAARVQSAGPAAAANRPTRPNREPNGQPNRAERNTTNAELGVVRSGHPPAAEGRDGETRASAVCPV